VYGRGKESGDEEWRREKESWNEGGRTSGKFLARLDELSSDCLRVIRIAERVEVGRRRKRLNLARSANLCLPRSFGEASLYLSRKTADDRDV